MNNLSNDVKIDRNYSHNHESFRNIIVELDQLEKLSTSKDIIIKPNFAAGSYIATNSHVVSDPIFLFDLIRFIRELNSCANIRIAESDSTQYGFAFLKFIHMGIENLDIPGVTLLDLSRDRLEQVIHPKARYFNNIDRQLWISKTLLEADYIISAANLKSHSITLYSGACKNLFGCLPTMNKEFYHTDIHDVLHDLVHVIKVNLSIVDGFFGLEKNGPVQGLPVSLGYRVFSNSPIYADIISCKAIGLDYKKVKHLNLIYSSDPFPIKDGVEKEIICKILRPTFWQRFFNYFGLFLQSIGSRIYEAGNRIHCADSPLSFFIILIRPILLRLFNINTLRKWKRKLANLN